MQELLVIIGLALMVCLFLSFPLFKSFKPDPEVNPEDYGWEFEHGHGDLGHHRSLYTKEGGWILYQSDYGWVLDKTPKNAPGVVERIKCLTELEMDIINDLSNLKEIHRKTAGGEI